MIRSISQYFRNPVFLLALAAGLLAFVVQSGELGTADTQHRLQTTHSWWTGQPQVFANEFPEFGVHGRDGKLQSWYGMGQSLLMFPSDVAGTYIARLPIFARYGDTDPSVRDIVISYSVNVLLCVLTALVCFRFLRQLGFSVRQSIAGVLALLIATTHLHYTQNMMENNYIFLLTLCGFSGQYEWLRNGSPRALLLGSAAFGLNLLTRITTALDLLAGGLFLLLVLCFEGTRGRELRIRCVSYLKTAVPVCLLFGLIDRAYQFYRFGSFFSTYLGVAARETKRLHPDLPPRYPFETPFHIGFFGPLFSPEKSIFLFDPLLLLMILLAVVAWRRFRPDAKAYLIAATALLLAYICFYARYTVWSGDFAWGDRYVSTGAEFAALLAVPLLLRHRRDIGRGVWITGMVLIVLSIAVQLASLAFWLPLEIYQMESLGHPTFVVWLRFKNIAAFALDKMGAWGLTNQAMTQDRWDYVHITTWNFLPFLLHRVGVAPAWAVRFAFAAWGAAFAALTGVLAQMTRLLRRQARLD